MKSRIAALASAIAYFTFANAEVAPEITIVAEGYNVIAKVPCVECPFLYQDTSKGNDAPWTQRKDANALVPLPSYIAFFKKKTLLIIILLALEYISTLRLGPPKHQQRRTINKQQDSPAHLRQPSAGRHTY